MLAVGSRSVESGPDWEMDWMRLKAQTGNGGDSGGSTAPAWGQKKPPTCGHQADTGDMTLVKPGRK